MNATLLHDLTAWMHEPPEPADRADGQFEEPYDGDTAAERDQAAHSDYGVTEDW